MVTGRTPGHVRVGVLTVSDRASRGEYEDLGGPAIVAYLSARVSSPWEAVRRVVPDDRSTIAAAIRELADDEGCSLVVTTGGTGPAPRDVTPEATMDACPIPMPGFGEAMRAASLRTVPTAILSRQVAALRGSTLVVNLPGKPAAIAECLDAVLPAVPYCIDLVGGPWMELRGGSPDPAARPGA